jgi:branched-chain amino acid transport system substrate-binding protein
VNRSKSQGDKMGQITFRHRFQALLVGSLLAALTACGGSANKKPAITAPPVVEAPPPVVEAPAPPLPPSTTAVARPQISNAMRVAVLVPMTGGSARIGQSIANAANLALLDLNSSKIRLSVYNTEGGAITAMNAALADGAKIILGPLFAADVRAVQPAARAAGVPLITFSNDAALATAGTYVLGFQPAQEVQRVVAYAKQRGILRFGALAPQGQYGSVTTRALQNAGVPVGAVESYPRDKTKVFAAARRISNYEARLLAARGAAASSGGAGTNNRLPPPPFDALLLPDSGGFLRAMLPLLKSYSVETPRVRFLGTGLWAAEPSLTKEPMLAGAWFASVPDGQFNSMAQRFQTQFGYAPPRLASLGYDAVLLAAAGSRNWSPGMVFPSGVLGNSAGYTGVDGFFRFNNSIAIRALEVQELTPGGLRTVSAASR